ncbi:hypothetical protein CGLO_13957 [Colletotrichum gloeosporioides Cg-14]|uniref:Uncharacterized protein n=1 Tax=Colletotrichum gloeosporioides (strain Cg-14) TaxID=1237896 RepID=T0K2M2_COLGC|nr:hypothetical protein CGLO_13957 [Colletotrichum gloeosporioides Cg-14]
MRAYRVWPEPLHLALSRVPDHPTRSIRISSQHLTHISRLRVVRPCLTSTCDGLAPYMNGNQPPTMGRRSSLPLISHAAPSQRPSSRLAAAEAVATLVFAPASSWQPNLEGKGKKCIIMPMTVMLRHEVQSAI